MADKWKEVETVDVHCKHKDCIYRHQIRSGVNDCCMYAAIEHQCRGCKISECTRYKPGQKIKARLTERTDIVWEYALIYEDEDGQYNL